jgi:hypothetical protein
MTGELEKGANGEAWQELRERVFFGLRYILTCKPRARPDTPKMGEIEAEIGGVLGTSSFRDKVTVTTVKRDQRTALTKFFESSEELAKISSSLATEFLPIGGPKFSMSADTSTKFAQAFAASRTVLDDNQETLSREINLAFTFDPGTTYYLVREYRRMCYDVFVTMIDFLYVQYQKKYLNYYRSKLPATDYPQ